MNPIPKTAIIGAGPSGLAACKVMQSRKRKKARTLHAEGQAIRRIANQIGVQEKLVRSWIN